MSAPVESVMTRDVAVVTPEASLETILSTLANKRISGVPVVTKSGHVLGVVSEGDLLLKVEHPDRKTARYWRELIDSSRYEAARHLAAELDKALARNAGDLMTAPAVTVRPDTSLVEAAQIMRTRGVKRLPVVDAEDRLVGIVSRADLARSIPHQERLGPDSPDRPSADSGVSAIRETRAVRR